MVKEKRILLLNYEFPPLGGGAGNATYYILKEFSKNKNIKIDLVTSSIGGFQKEEFSKNITIHYLDIKKRCNIHFQKNKDLLRYSWEAYKYSKKLAKENSYDLCHAFFGIPCGYIALKLKRKFKIPYIVSLRGSDVPGYNMRYKLPDRFVFKKMSRRIWREAEHVVANSDGLKELANSKISEQEISVIPNGIDLEEFKPKRKKKNNKKITLISTGRLIERKGYDYLINAISDLDEVELWLIGDGNLSGHLELKAKQLNANVKFLGKRDHEDIPYILSSADIFVLPSLNEGMSNSILEAMALGLPIITTDTGGSEELIQDNGFIVKRGSSTKLKYPILEYIKDPKLIKKHGKKSREIAEGMGWDRVARDYLELYEK